MKKKKKISSLLCIMFSNPSPDLCQKLLAVPLPPAASPPSLSWEKIFFFLIASGRSGCVPAYLSSLGLPSLFLLWTLCLLCPWHFATRILQNILYSPETSPSWARSAAVRESSISPSSRGFLLTQAWAVLTVQSSFPLCCSLSLNSILKWNRI